MPEERKDKITNRTMGEYSISKSYKGILRISHIMELVDTESDDFLNPTYFGNPSELMNISGGTYKSKEYGYQTAIKGMQPGGGIQRYESSNPRISVDKLKLNRVPMTDSMGNYMNWNVGLDGVTIGSNEDINGNDYSISSFKQWQNTKSSTVYQSTIFPVLETQELTVGLENKILRSNKKAVNKSITSIETGTKPAMLSIENFWESTPWNKQEISLYKKGIEGEKIPYKGYQFKTPKYSKTKNGETFTGGTNYSKIRTIFKNDKDYPQDYDVFMYRQNDYDVDNWDLTPKTSLLEDNEYNENVCNRVNTKILDCFANVDNLKEYVKKIIDKYMKGNVIEVPSGAVIWQYCSLEKWRAQDESPKGDATKLCEGGYPGHRPSLQIKDDNGKNPFFSSTIQGVCKKINRLRKNYKEEKTNDNEESEDDSMLIHEDSAFRKEIIPLYKRDYVLCDGSKYRVPYTAPLESNTTIPLIEHMERFFELFFNIGYRYTNRDFLQARCLSNYVDSNGYFPIDAASSAEKTLYVNSNNITHSFMNATYVQRLDRLYEKPLYSVGDWVVSNATNGYGFPKMELPTSDKWDNCDDFDVLFQEDMATMLACTEIYKEYKKHPDYRLMYKDEGKSTETSHEWNFDTIKKWLKQTKLPESYVFNSFIGDNKESMKTYYQYSEDGIKKNYKSSDGDYISVMNLQYNYCLDKTTPIINLGREVTTFGSPIKFYNPTTKRYEITCPANLPMVNFFITLITSKYNYDGALQVFFTGFYNYDFQVPNLMAKDGTPVFIGSGAYGESDDNYYKVKTVNSWSSSLTAGDIPHRHGIFKGAAPFMNSWENEQRGDAYKDKNFPADGNIDENINPYDYDVTNLSNSTPTSLYSEPSSSEGVVRIQMNKVIHHTDEKGNYIIKPISVNYEKNKGASYCPYNLIHFGNESDTTAKIFGWGSSLNQSSSNEDNENTDLDDDNPDKYSSFTTADGDLMSDYFNSIKGYNYSLRFNEDPRFVHNEPNRGVSSPPHESKESETTLVNFKNEDAKAIFFNTSSYNWFSPENVQMLPLIKL